MIKFHMRKVKPFIHILSNFHEFLSTPTPSAAAVNWSGSEARFEETRLCEGRNILQDIRSGEEQYYTGPKSLSGILTNKSEISLVATFLALANTIILRHAVSSLKKLLTRFVSPVAVVAEEFMRCLYMHSTFPWSCTAETLLFVQPVSNVFWPTRIVLFEHTCMS